MWLGGARQVGSLIVVHGRLGYANGGIGVATMSNLDGGNLLSGGGDSVFGFVGDSLYWDDRHVGAGMGQSGMGVTLFTVDPIIDSFVIPNASLSDINADATNIAEGFTLWTANAGGDTFNFSRTAPVPEPSAALLCGLGALGLIRRCR